MADPTHLSKRERQIMDVIYARRHATATHVLAEMPDPPTRGAVRAFLRILEDKGHLTHRKDGREFVYSPTHPRQRVGRSAFGRVVDVFFGGSIEKALAAHLSDPGRENKPSAEELRRLGELIEEAKRKGV